MSETVFVVDDDRSVRTAVESLLRSVGLPARSFASTSEFMEASPGTMTGCLVLDIRMPGRNGLDFQRDLIAAGISLPVVFITGHGDIPMSVRALKSGAVDFLTKPFRDQDLLDAVHSAFEKDRARRAEESAGAELRSRYDLLSAREREVFALATGGSPNKQIASELGLSEVTVKVHRGNAMRKMGAESFADLVRMAGRLGISRQH